MCVVFLTIEYLKMYTYKTFRLVFAFHIDFPTGVVIECEQKSR